MGLISDWLERRRASSTKPKRVRPAREKDIERMEVTLSNGRKIECGRNV